MVGMKKNGRRLLIVPPALAYGKKVRVRVRIRVSTDMYVEVT